MLYWDEKEEEEGSNRYVSVYISVVFKRGNSGHEVVESSFWKMKETARYRVLAYLFYAVGRGRIAGVAWATSKTNST